MNDAPDEYGDDLQEHRLGQNRRWHHTLEQLKELANGPEGDLIRGMVNSIVQLSEVGGDRRDMRMFYQALKESRRALAVFSQYRHIPKIAVFGSARTDPATDDYQQARAFASGIADRGFMVITGAGGGIMAAAQEGAGAARSFGLNIDLPFEQYPNSTIDGDPKLLSFNFFFTRKLFFLKETRAIALFPGGFGTMDEGFEALTLIQTGKAIPMPVLLMEPPGSGYWEAWLDYVEEHLLGRGLIHESDLKLFSICHSAEDGVAEVADFFKVFHSAHAHDEGMSIWLYRELEDAELASLNVRFAELLDGGEITRLCVPAPALGETGEPPLSCIDLPMNHRMQGQLRDFIDALNVL